ncbi:MAG: hypothetical protein K9H49_09445 [Bacteroidales bacterium]|nr:hypothetical protein [Bacteroidales bacterium]MCF8390128.1 hypothetical protein [Bacteroidales bacterium]
MKANLLMRKSLLIITLLSSVLFAGRAQKNVGENDNRDIWALQVSSMSINYDLTGKEILKLSNAYVKMRTNVVEQNKLVDKNSNPEAFQANVAKNELAGMKLIKKSVYKLLKDEQADEAMLLLGSFNARWDSYQKVLIDLNLTEEELATTSKLLADYMKDYLLARKISEESGERFSGRTASELKTKLDKAISENLDQVNFADWEKATQRKPKKLVDKTITL